MKSDTKIKRIAILGGGPAGLFMYKQLLSAGLPDIEIDIFERKQQLGAGMPYSTEGASLEHITNVSGNEIPEIVTPVNEWIQRLSPGILNKFHIDIAKFNDYKVLPRLLFGQYLSDQFQLLREKAEAAGIKTVLHLKSAVTDVIDHPDSNVVWVEVEAAGRKKFDRVIICTGHEWPKRFEGKVPGYFDSPYPPAKLALRLNHTVAIKGSSLTAIDAIRTLARHNGKFTEETGGKLSFRADPQSPNFRLVLHSRSGLLPAVRFHLEDSHLSNSALLTPEEISAERENHNGFLPLDVIFEKDFKRLFRDKDPEFYEFIKQLSMEEFVEAMMNLRERLDPFVLLKAEYAEAEKSIRRHESVYWKEMLAVLSFAMNYPAKHLPAEDMIRLQKVLMPLISIVIAFVPQASCRELLALHDAGRLDITAVGEDSTIEPKSSGGIVYHFSDSDGDRQAVAYKTFVDCVGQPHLSFTDFPFKGLLRDRTISPAKLAFSSQQQGKAAAESGNPNVLNEQDTYYLSVPGININDDFQVVDAYGAYNERIFIMAVPYIGGYNPDYSGLDFCEAASKKIAKRIQSN